MMKKILTILSVILLMTGTSFANGKGNYKERKSKEPLTLLETNTTASTGTEDTGGSGGGSDPKPPTVKSDTASSNIVTSTGQSWVEWLLSLIFG